MKTCTHCHKTKSLTEYYKRTLPNNRGDGYQPCCKPCHYNYNLKYRIKRNNKLLIWYNSLKKNPCTDCGKTYPPCVMHWDHLPQYKKSNDVGYLFFIGKQAVEKEIAKCELVCANCHAIRTWITRKERPLPIF